MGEYGCLKYVGNHRSLTLEEENEILDIFSHFLDHFLDRKPKFEASQTAIILDRSKGALRV